MKVTLGLGWFQLNFIFIWKTISFEFELIMSSFKLKCDYQSWSIDLNKLKTNYKHFRIKFQKNLSRAYMKWDLLGFIKSKYVCIFLKQRVYLM